MKISIVIVAKNEFKHLWHTIHNLREYLKDYDYEIILIDDGSDEYQTREYFSSFSNVQYHRVMFDGANPSKQFGLDKAMGDIVYMADAHIVVPSDFFPKTLKFLKEHPKCSALYTPLKFKDKIEYAHYKINFDTFEWEGIAPPKEPYKCIIGNQGLFAVRKSLWKGFAPFKGYGAGEVFSGLRNTMYGNENWMLPDTYHTHWTEGREYKMDYKQLRANMIASAYILGGNSDKVYEYFSKEIQPWVNEADYEAIKTYWQPLRDKTLKEAKHTLNEVKKNFENRKENRKVV